MNISEKLITIADNVPKVAKAVDAARVRLEGAAVRADGVAEIPLKVQLKNKNLLSAPTLDAERDKNLVLFEGSITGDFVFSCVFDYSECKAPTAAQFSFVVDGVEIYMSRGTVEKRETAFSGTLTKITFLNWGYGVGSVGQIQLEYGTVSTDYTPHIEDFLGVGVNVFGKNLLSAFSKFPTQIAHTATPIFMKAGQKYTFSFKGEYTAWRLMFRGTQMDGSDFPTGSAVETQDDFISCTQRTATASDATYGTRIQMQNNATGNSIVLTCTNDFILTAMQLWVTGTEVTPFYECQLELGSVATDYEAYKAPQTAQADSSGKVTGIVPVVPTMTVVADSGIAQVCYLPDGQVWNKYQQIIAEERQLADKLKEV